MADLRMPFGKHKGKPLRSVPRAYLEWLFQECTDLETWPWLRPAVEHILKGDGSALVSNNGNGIGQVIHLWHAEMVKQFKSDSDTMAIVDYGNSLLRELAGLDVPPKARHRQRGKPCSRLDK